MRLATWRGVVAGGLVSIKKGAWIQKDPPSPPSPKKKKKINTNNKKREMA